MTNLYKNDDSDNKFNNINFEELLNRCLTFYENQEYTVMAEFAREAKRRNPYHLMANYLSAIANSCTDHWLQAYADLRFLEQLQNIYQVDIVSAEELQPMIMQAKKMVMQKDDHKMAEQLQQIGDHYVLLQANLFTSFKPIDKYFRPLSLGGRHYYMAGYLTWGESYMNVTDTGSCLTNKFDIYQIDAITKKRTYSNLLPCIVPIVNNSSIDDYPNVLKVTEQTNEYTIHTPGFKKYDYYRIDEPITLTAKNPAVFGKPIPLHHDPKRKKLVLSIFLDSCNWKVIKEHSLKECMPHTYDFFQGGIICNEFYAGSEFTYPSIASYWTGLRSSRHKMLNQSVKRAMPADRKVFPEIFQEAGYFTAKIGGNDSVIPDFGYMRGIDRFLYQYWQEGFFAHEAVHQTIEHMEAFQETDQYIWLDIPDLHDVAGMWDMPLSVQTSCPIHVNEIDFTGRYPGTLYHTPSPNRREVYLKEMAYIDRQLAVLYRYIKEHYKKDEVIVTLFSDHGNGFNVDAGQPFLSWQRENVPLMIYGPEFTHNVCDEPAESVDYGHILCHLAGLEDPSLEENDGNLPAFCGGTEKEYVFAQSQHPDREYAAFVGTKKYRFYLESYKKVDKDCRIEISAGAYVKLVDMNDQEFHDPDILEKCKAIVMENIRDFAY